MADYLTRIYDRSIAVRIILERREKRLEKIIYFLLTIVIAMIIVAVFEKVFPGLYAEMPFWHFVRWEGSISQLLSSYWFLLVWAALIKTIVVIVTRSSKFKFEKDYMEELLVEGLKDSIVAGIFEELYFRWVYFFLLIPGIVFSNWLLFGFTGWVGVEHWLYSEITVPVVNFITFGKLSDVLLLTPWYVGAAMVTVGAKFRDGHIYQGLAGWVNSWFVGMVLFHIVWNHGIFPAIVFHIVYNVIIYIVSYIDNFVERQIRPVV